MAELFLTSLYIILGVLAGLGAVVWAACRATDRDGVEAVIDGDGKRQGLLNRDAVVIAVPGGGHAPEPVDVHLCAICKARLAGAGVEEGPCRRLWPCRHVYHAECIDLWLDRRLICPLCRAGVVVSRTETIGAIV